MTANYKAIIDNSFNDQENWNYYSGKDFITNPIYSEDESINFLQNFLILSGKGANEFNRLIYLLTENRANHIVSAFFLGHYLYQNPIFKKEIDKAIKILKTEQKVSSVVTFSYIWFLICLFHDIGYSIEKEQPIKYKTIDDLLIDGKLEEIYGIPKFYGIIFKNYYKYIIEVNCKNDHGITIAHIMYRELCNIRRLAENPNQENNNSKLSWEKDLDKVYNFAAWNVLAHNIWYGDKSNICDIKNFNKYKIRRLLFDGKYKISLKKHPFLFLFCLVDAIEPYKSIKDIELLDKIELIITDDKITIFSNIRCACGDNILEKAESLGKWLTKTNREENSNYVEIFL